MCVCVWQALHHDLRRRSLHLEMPGVTSKHQTNLQQNYSLTYLALVLCEVPESYEAHKKQKNRWHSGPMQLFCLCLGAILTSKIAIWKKPNLILLFFLLRKPFFLSTPSHCSALSFYSQCLYQKLSFPFGIICYIPVFMSFLILFPSPKSFPFIVPYLL
ncbi:unnamed protein product [Eruca vesicaria subsp. sativa]|uniref:Uncharacterized protein n=1 Tax=Eruca vesicaria subsp. sativa TaxID=29727 RepID=A0ABC8LSZ3_ERUVS|nr:unnamed protein product [Eruca vesicaria subsp. sativa]